jgi:hypothetical protein
MQHSSTPKRTRRSRHPRQVRLSPYLLDDIAFTRSDIKKARSDSDTASAA